MDDFNFKEYELGLEAREFIKECLGGGNTLAQTFLRIFDFEKGRVITALPLGIDPEEAKDFEDGIFPEPPKSESRIFVESDGSKWVMVPKPNTDFWLVSIIRMFLVKEDKRLCILENALARPNDPWISLKKHQIFTFKGEVYHFLLGMDVEGKRIEQTIRNASSHLFIGLLTSVPQETPFPRKGHEVSFEELKVFAKRTEKIIVGAYDGEGYLVWEKRRK